MFIFLKLTFIITIFLTFYILSAETQNMNLNILNSLKKRLLTTDIDTKGRYKRSHPFSSEVPFFILLNFIFICCNYSFFCFYVAYSR